MQWFFSRVFGFAISTICGLVMFTTGYAASVVDQSSLPAGVNALFRPPFNTESWAQSFTPMQSNITGATLFFYRIPATVTPVSLTIKLWDDIPGTGLLLASTTQEMALGLVGQTVANDVFWAPVSAIPGHTYFIQPITDSLEFGIAVIAGNPYLTGALYRNGSVLNAGGRSDWDARFKEYANVAAIPEPSQIALTLAGLFLVFAVVHRRNR